MFGRWIKGVAMAAALSFVVSAAGQAEVQAGYSGSVRGTEGDRFQQVLDVSKAVRISLGQLYSFDVASGKSLFHFVTGSGKYYYQVKAALPAGVSCHVELYDETGSSIAGQADLTDGAFGRFALEPSAEYFLSVSGESGTAGEIIISGIADDYPDTSDGAASIKFNSEYSVTAECSADVDCLTFTTDDKDASYTLTIDPAVGNIGEYALLDSEGLQIESCSGVSDQAEKLTVKLEVEPKKTYFLMFSSSELCRQMIVSIKQTVNKYKIAYYLNGGKNHKDNKTSYTATQSIVLKNPTYKGYIFEGWYTSSDFKSKVTAIKGSAKRNYDLYAKWKKVTVGTVSVTSFASTNPGKAKLVFGAVSGAKEYQVSITRKKNGKVRSQFSQKTSVAYTDLVQGEKYEVTVRAYALDSCGNRVYGAYSKAKSVTVKKKEVKVKKNNKSKKKSK